MSKKTRKIVAGSAVMIIVIVVAFLVLVAVGASKSFSSAYDGQTPDSPPGAPGHH